MVHSFNRHCRRPSHLMRQLLPSLLARLLAPLPTPPLSHATHQRPLSRRAQCPSRVLRFPSQLQPAGRLDRGHLCHTSTHAVAHVYTTNPVKLLAQHTCLHALVPPSTLLAVSAAPSRDRAECSSPLTGDCRSTEARASSDALVSRRGRACWAGPGGDSGLVAPPLTRVCTANAGGTFSLVALLVGFCVVSAAALGLSLLGLSLLELSPRCPAVLCHVRRSRSSSETLGARRARSRGRAVAAAGAGAGACSALGGTACGRPRGSVRANT